MITAQPAHPQSAHPPPAIRTHRLCFGYPGHEVLHEVDLDVAAGLVTVVTGPNGSGKSTLIELLAGVRRPDRGRVQRSGEVALVVQRPAAPETLPLTVYDVVAMGTWGRHLRRREARARVAETIDAVGLAGFDDRPLGELSGGQRQRALLAQALARRADIILMDEPDTGLDSASRARIRDLLIDQARRRGVAVVCATHDEALIASADRTIRLEVGADRR